MPLANVYESGELFNGKILIESEIFANWAYWSWVKVWRRRAAEAFVSLRCKFLERGIAAAEFNSDWIYNGKAFQTPCSCTRQVLSISLGVDSLFELSSFFNAISWRATLPVSGFNWELLFLRSGSSPSKLLYLFEWMWNELKAPKFTSVRYWRHEAV